MNKLLESIQNRLYILEEPLRKAEEERLKQGGNGEKQRQAAAQALLRNYRGQNT